MRRIEPYKEGEEKKEKQNDNSAPFEWPEITRIVARRFARERAEEVLRLNQERVYFLGGGSRIITLTTELSSSDTI